MSRLAFASRTLVGCLLVGALAGAAPALAAARGASAATLAAPAAAATPLIIDGRVWRCVETACSAAPSSAADSQPAPRECARAAAKLGAVVAYESGPRVLDPAEITACNAAAPRPR